MVGEVASVASRQLDDYQIVRRTDAADDKRNGALSPRCVAWDHPVLFRREKEERGGGRETKRGKKGSGICDDQSVH